MEGMVKVQVLRAACCVAGSDGLTDPAERKIVELLAREVGVGAASLEAMLQRAETEPDYVKDQFRVLKANPKETMGTLFTVAFADKSLTDRELATLGKLAEKLDVSKEQYEEWLVQARAFSAKQK